MKTQNPPGENKYLCWDDKFFRRFGGVLRVVLMMEKGEVILRAYHDDVGLWAVRPLFILSPPHFGGLICTVNSTTT